MVGEIHLAKIQFTDAAGSKVRPVLLLKSNSFGDAVYLPLTTNTLTKGVTIGNEQLMEGYLPKQSVVVYEKPGVIATVLLTKKIGRLDRPTYHQIVDKLVAFLKMETA